MTEGPVKVSVVVPTYRSGKGLNRLVASLDAQTLPTSDWEVVFVDDGSPDDTYERLLAIQSERPNVRIERIENSGWPCRPRNIGTDLARGEYVAYMDHDDELYPDALRAAYEFAKEHDSDVVNGKEARTHDSGWAIDQYRADSGQVIDRTDFHPLIPTNPHKLYRRALLQEHGIRFREGGRVLWEDIFFNVLVARHAKVISTMASTPYYHWFSTPGSGSSTFVRSSPEWWYWLDKVVEAVNTDLAGDELATQRRLLRVHQYRSRLLDSFNNLYAPRDAAERKMIFEKASALQAKHFPESDDEHLNRSLRMRAQLLRRGYRHLLERLTVDDPNIPGAARITDAQWDGAVLRLTTRADWEDSTGRRHRLVERDGRIVKDLPKPYHDALPADLFDVTDDIHQATVEIGLRSEASRVTWMASSTTELHTAVTDGVVRWHLTGTATVDPATDAMGRPLERGVWLLNGRCALAGTVQHRIIRRSHIPPAIRFDTDGVIAVFSRKDGVVALDFDQTESPLTRLVRPTGRARRVGTVTSIEVTGLPVDGDRREFATTLDIDTESLARRVRRVPRRVLHRLRRRDPGPRGWRTVPARLVVGDGGASIEIELPTTDAFLVRIGGRVPGFQPVQQVSRGHELVRPYGGLARGVLS